MSRHSRRKRSTFRRHAPAKSFHPSYPGERSGLTYREAEKTFSLLRRLFGGRLT